VVLAASVALLAAAAIGFGVGAAVAGGDDAVPASDLARLDRAERSVRHALRGVDDLRAELRRERAARGRAERRAAAAERRARSLRRSLTRTRRALARAGQG
jgi:hypothetical protein